MKDISVQDMASVIGGMGAVSMQGGGNRGLSNTPTFWTPRVEDYPEGGFTIYKKHHGTPYLVKWSNGTYAPWSQ